MKAKLFLPVLFALIAVAPRAWAQTAPEFDAVFAIMTGDPGQMGCRGCHVGPKPGFGPWWGNNEATVYNSLVTGMTPDMETLDPIPVDGGRNGVLGVYLTEATMPLFGSRWTQEQLDNVLYPFLDLFAPSCP